MIKVLLLSTVLLNNIIKSQHRNLQFSHYVEGYLYSDFPPQFGIFLDQTGNNLDPYLTNLPVSTSVGYGTNSDLYIRVVCQLPLVLRSGACACPFGSTYIKSRNICISEQGAYTSNGFVSNQGADHNLRDKQCPLSIVRNNLYPNTIAALANIDRQFDGSNNNIYNTQWGAVNTPLERITNSYSDGRSTPKSDLPSPRVVSNLIGSFGNSSDQDNRLEVSIALVIFGQFLDHDIDLTEAQHPNKENNNVEYLNIKIPKNDQFFRNQNYLQFTRSQYFMSQSGVRNFENMVTSWIDGSQIYGSDSLTNCILRQFKKGKLKTSADDLLPIIDNNHRAGDIRAIENVILSGFHILFLREHNRKCDQILHQFPDLNDEQVFQSARNYVIGILQKIVYKDFLPIMLGDSYQKHIGLYKGYNPNINPSLPLEFSTAIFRIGHSLLASKFVKKNQYYQTIGSFKLDELFFATHLINSQTIDELFRGLNSTPMKQKSPQIINEIRNLLVLDIFRRQTKLDLFSLNLQRGRDHGIGSYNDLRRQYGLYALKDFYGLLPDTQQGRQSAQKLYDLYGTPNRLDLWLGIICQKPVQNGILGELGATILGQTFRNLRDGDRFYYQNNQYYPNLVKNQIEKTTLSQVIRRNSGINYLPNNIFFMHKQ